MIEHRPTHKLLSQLNMRETGDRHTERREIIVLNYALGGWKHEKVHYSSFRAPAGSAYCTRGTTHAPNLHTRTQKHHRLPKTNGLLNSPEGADMGVASACEPRSFPLFPLLVLPFATRPASRHPVLPARSITNQTHNFNISERETACNVGTKL